MTKATKTSPLDATASGTKKASDIYQKMEHKEHIYKKPDTYTGSCEQEEYPTYLLKELANSEEKPHIEGQTIRLTPAFYKCFDELLVNAHDHKKRMEKVVEKEKEGHHPVTSIKVTVNEDQSITFFNDGDGILVEYMEEHKMYPAELIFGSLLTSTNFDDNEQREWGGRNGYGAKLANIFSKRFEIETVCHVHKKKFHQVFKENMSIRGEPVVKSCSNKPYTKITWLPDYERFHMMTGLTDDIRSLVLRRVYDIAGVTDKNTKVYFNDKQLEIKSFDKYVELYLPATHSKVVFDEGPGWHIAVTNSEDDVFQQVSFVNGINTIHGGTHVEYIADQIKTKLAVYLKSKKKLDVKPQIIKNQLRIFVNATKIINPAFDSQTKETLKTPKSKFGTLFEISDKFITNLSKTDLIEKIQNQAAFKDTQLLSKSDGSKKKHIRVEKLEDAAKAGTKDSKQCTIIFTEGDSAKAMAMAGRAEVGSEFYGVYPLRGKILNVRDAATTQIMNCQVLNNIKQIIGLQNGKDYKKEFEQTGVWPLRYGKMMLMTDQDHDGSHIKGLMMNMFDSMWSSLLDVGFVTTMVTPIVKAFKGTIEKVFYTLQDYEKWKETVTVQQWRIKYYKGLGTSTAKEAKEYFKNLKLITYQHPEEAVEVVTAAAADTTSIGSTHSLSSTKSKNPLDLAFNKKRADDRKVWLKEYDRNIYPDYNQSQMSFKDFVDQELIHFSNEDNDRSIPSLIDGLKPSQRKVLFACFKRNLISEIRVAQLAGYVSEHAGYHHGETSLEHAIVGLAQDYVGANNLNYLRPIGQFGSRLQNGADAAQSRYIHTELNKLTRYLFKKEDDALCHYLNDDGYPIEPEYYFPIIPTLLVNGSVGIGTGFSTSIPQFHPVELCNSIIQRLDGHESSFTLHPWYRGFTGTITTVDERSYICKGKVEVISPTKVRITELPIGRSTDEYLRFIDIASGGGKDDSKAFIRSFRNDSTDVAVNLTLDLDEAKAVEWHSNVLNHGVTELESRLKLTESISMNNMHMFDEQGHITKFGCLTDMIQHWFTFRQSVYTKRRQFVLDQLKKELDIIQYKVRFILEIVANTFEIRNKKKAWIIQELEQRGYLKIAIKDNAAASYDYLLSMDLYKLTEEEIDELKKKKEYKEAEYQLIFQKTSDEIWREELIEFRDAYSKHLEEYVNELHGITSTSSKSNMTVKRKLTGMKNTSKTKK